MHLPYVRKVFEGKDIKIVPLMIGQIKDYPSLAKHLVTYFMDDRTLFVISSDFCHWGSRFDFQHKYENYQEIEIYKSIEQLDREAMQIIENHSLEGFQKYLKDTKNTICGRNPIQLLLAIIELADKNNLKTEFVKYDQSSQVRNMSDSSVSYASSITTLL